MITARQYRIVITCQVTHAFCAKPNDGKLRMKTLVWCISAQFLILNIRGEDWPQFLGPRRNGESASAINLNWPKEGPAVVWQMKVGEGFSAPVVGDSKLILFHRVENKERLDCVDARTGKPIWHYEYPTEYQDDFGRGNGPRATPTV